MALLALASVLLTNITNICSHLLLIKKETKKLYVSFGLIIKDITGDDCVV